MCGPLPSQHPLPFTLSSGSFHVVRAFCLPPLHGLVPLPDIFPGHPAVSSLIVHVRSSLLVRRVAPSG